MKKVFFLAATAALALSSCSENEITSNVENSRRTPISVSVYSKGQTRAVTGLADLQSNGFDLVIKAASITTPLFADKCTYSAATTDQPEAWKLGNDAIYWPLNEEEVVSFYALYCPAPAETSGIEATQTSYSSTIQLTTDANADVVAAYASSSLKGNNSDKMELAFSHLLSEIHFAIEGGEAGYVYTLKEITLKGASSGVVTYKSTCSIAPDAQATDETFPVYDSSVAGTAAVVYDATNNATADPVKVGTVSLMLIPDTYAVSVTYNVAAGTDSQDFTKGGTIDLSENAGMKTAATLKLPASRTPLSISASVAEWTDGNAVSPTLK